MRALLGRATLPIALAVVTAWAPPVSAEILRVAVAPIEAPDVSGDVVRAVEELLASQLARRPELTTVSDEDVRRLLALEAQLQILGQEDDTTLAQVRDMLDADRLVRGSLTRLESFWLLSLSLLDTREGQVVSRITHRVHGDRAALLDALPAAVGELLEIPARLHLSRQIDGGRLFIEDTLVGEMPLAPFPVRGSGTAALRAEHFDHAAFSTEIELVPGRTTRVRLDMPSFAELEHASAVRRRFGWASAGVGLLAGGAGGWSAAEGWSAKRAYDAMDVRRTSQAELDAAARRSATLVYGGYAGMGVAAALVGTGIWLLADDPHRARLAHSSGGGGGLAVAF